MIEATRTLPPFVLAQIGDLVDPIEVVGGSILIAVGVVALRMVLNAARHERESAHVLETRLLGRIVQLEEDLSDERNRSARLIVAYDRERQLRIALELASGTPHVEPGSTRDDVFGIYGSDRMDLEEEIDASQ